jgi:hypothetical protein
MITSVFGLFYLFDFYLLAGIFKQEHKRHGYVCIELKPKHQTNLFMDQTIRSRGGR